MCGILGVICSNRRAYRLPSIRAAMDILAAGCEVRGKDSSGLAFHDAHGAAMQVFKGAVPLTSLRNAAEPTAVEKARLDDYLSGKSPFAAIGHSRLVTNGSQLCDGNNQPVIKDGLVGIHNGIIVNDGDLWQRHPELTRQHQIDTEVLLAMIKQRLRASCSIANAIADVARQVEGTFSIALMFDDRPCVALATNNGSLYSLIDEGRAVFFASEEFPLRRVAKAIGAAQLVPAQVEPNTGVVVHLDDLTVEPFRFDRARPRKQAVQERANPTRLAIRSQSISAGAQGELVVDVNEIATAPEASRLESMLECNSDRIANLRRCSSCILPHTFPFIDFDGDGVCNYCRNYRIKNQPKPLSELQRLLEPYRRRDGRPDCIVPFSGGRDSTFALHFIKSELKLNPIAFTYDWGMVTDLGRRNIARVCGKLGVENIIVAADIRSKRENIRLNVEAWLRRPELAMVPLFMAGDKHFYHYVKDVKRQTGIALNIWGINPLENTDFKVGFNGVAPDHAKPRIYTLTAGRQARLFGAVAGNVLRNPSYVNRSLLDTLGGFVSRSILPHTDYFHLYDFVRWDEQEIDRVLLGEYAWEKAIDTPTTWRIGDGTAAFYNYIYYTVAGFSEHDTFRSNQIREGMLDRKQALRLVREENRPRYPTLKWYTDVIQIDYEKAVRTINAIPKLYQ